MEQIKERKQRVASQIQAKERKWGHLLLYGMKEAVEEA